MQIGHSTHDVLNQPPPLVDHNLFSSDPVLRAALVHQGAAWAADRATSLGERLGRADVQVWAAEANDNPPTLRTHDRYGHRIDEAHFHPAWHQLMALSVGERLHNLPWAQPREGAHVARAALFYLMAQVEQGHGCPISMSYAAVPALRREPAVWEQWREGLLSDRYDGQVRPAHLKPGAIFGMAMTEKQGGSDVQANTTRAEAIGAPGPGQEHLLTGHKWFCSAPNSDAFLMLARTQGGLTCFVVPRFTPDGQRNAIYLQRLKNKLGNRSNASSEIELHRAWARQVGEEGRGVPTIIEMVAHTRLDCALGSSAQMRAALVQALHHARHRRAFGARLIDQDLMRNVLADLALESEAATLLALRLARAYDGQDRGDDEGPLRRILAAIAKYWICKRSPVFCAEALECLGGAGYVEESGMPRLLRESPVNSIWEGSGNVICLDVLRAVGRTPEVLGALQAELATTRGADPAYDTFCERLRVDLSRRDDLPFRARVVVERMALALQASLLLRHAPAEIAATFCRSRLGAEWGLSFGTLPQGSPVHRILERVLEA